MIKGINKTKFVYITKMQYTIYVQVKRSEPWSILTSSFTKKIGKLSKFGEYELSVHIL